MTIRTLTVFKSRIPSVNYIMPNGKPLIFQAGQYLTDDIKEIEHLKAEIKAGHAHIFQESAPEAQTIQSDMLDPMAALKAKFFAEFQAQQQSALDPKSDKGTTTQVPLKPASSKDIAPAASNGAVLVNLPAKA